MMDSFRTPATLPEAPLVEAPTMQRNSYDLFWNING